MLAVIVPSPSFLLLLLASPHPRKIHKTGEFPYFKILKVCVAFSVRKKKKLYKGKIGYSGKIFQSMNPLAN